MYEKKITNKSKIHFVWFKSIFFSDRIISYIIRYSRLKYYVRERFQPLPKIPIKYRYFNKKKKSANKVNLLFMSFKSSCISSQREHPPTTTNVFNTIVMKIFATKRENVEIEFWKFDMFFAIESIVNFPFSAYTGYIDMYLQSTYYMNTWKRFSYR